MESDTSDRSYFFETYFTDEIYIEPRESEREESPSCMGERRLQRGDVRV